MKECDRRSRRCWKWLAALLLCAEPVVARAAEPPTGSEGVPTPDPGLESKRTEAARRYARAVELVAEGDLKLALVEFQRAYALLPSYRVLYNLGVVYDQLGRYADSVQAYERFLHEGAEAISEERRKEVLQSLGTLRARTAWLVVSVSEPGADILLDGSPIGKSPMHQQKLIDAGSHTVTVNKSGWISAQRPVSPAGGDTASISVTLVAVPKPDVAPSAPIGTYVLWGVSGVTAIASAVFAISWKSSAEELDALKGRQSTESDRRDAASRVETNRFLTFAFGGASLASLGVALYFTLRSEGPSKSVARPTLRVHPGLGSVSLGGTF